MLVMKKKIVSILCPSYNHEKYVAGFIESVLAQTNPNWELVIVDDNSSDKNVDVIKQYSDPRIKLIEHKWNQGINAGLNDAFAASSGDYISFCASDDKMCPDYIETIISTFETNTNIGVIYTDLYTMDSDGNFIKDNILRNNSGTKQEILQDMFLNMNTLTSPGMSIKRFEFEKISPVELPMSMYQDYKLHVMLLLNTDFIIQNKPIIIYRQPSKKSGISYFNETAVQRMNLEEDLFMNAFLAIKTIEQLRSVFAPELLQQFKKMDKDLIPYYLGTIALQHSKNTYKKIWGYNQIKKMLLQPQIYGILHKKHGFNYKSFLDLSDFFIRTDLIRQKYIKYKRLFNHSIICFCIIFFSLLFVLLI